MARFADTLEPLRDEPSTRQNPEVTTVPVLNQLGKLSGPRQVLLGAVALLLASSGLPWYHLENRGFTFDLTGWHELGPLVWGMAVLLLAWEVSRMARLVPVGGDEGDRVSAWGGLAVAFVGFLYVLRRLLDGDLGYGWVVGAVLIAALAAASVSLFDAARGRESLAARFGDGEAPEETRPHDPDAPRPGAPPTPEWRRPQRDVGAPAPATPMSAPPARDTRLSSSAASDERFPLSPARPSAAPSSAPAPASPVPPWRAKDAEWSPGGRPAWRADEEDAPDAPVMPAARTPIVPSGPGPSAAPEPPPVAPHRVDDRSGWVPPWRRGRRGSDGAAGDGRDRDGRSSSRRRTEDVPPWREPGEVSPPPGGWPKSIAEKQRDEPPLWG